VFIHEQFGLAKKRLCSVPPDGVERDGGCWEMFRCKASDILRNEAYFSVRRSDEE
jgi:hypothetical protein